ncbi:hypothetical protein RJ639_004500 [Escallonia herrerae]|uniref:Myb-like domain-containing protein n=1 Tax=Escallonia herrerae TaxID=1293975 RepID=A0AA88W1F1_9ASTE|nr:hypothetical protein RJ639_004500 [Escallonia herrerae]
MALEQLSLAPAPVDGETDAAPNGGDDGNKAPRLPRWTRQEILVLIQGKRVAENRVRRGRTAGLAFGSGQVEPKWASVSSYCKRHGVNRGPVQCRKRWSNLAGDYKKIKEWESQIKKEETESFWVTRNDLRRERKLPGFFDKEVYDILDGGGSPAEAMAAPTELALALTPSTATAAEEEVEAEVVFDSGRSAAADDGLFSDFEQSGHEEVGASPEKELPPVKEAPATSVPAPTPISAAHTLQGSATILIPFIALRLYFTNAVPEALERATHEKPPTSNPEIGTHHDGCKRKRFTVDGDEETSLQHQLVGALERNGRLLSSQLEAQNTNSQLDREQRKDHVNSLVTVLNKLADAFGRIADKL